MNNLSDGFYKLYERGLSDEILGIPSSFTKIDDVIHGFQKSRYWTLGGLTGSGKTAFADEFFVIDIFDWWYKNYNCSEDVFKISWIYNSMERGKDYKIAKWTALKLYKDTGDLLSTDTILGFTKHSKSEKLILENQVRRKHHDRIKSYKDFFDEMQKHITIYSGSINPTGLFKRFTKFAEQHGKLTKNNQSEDVFTYNHPNHYVFGVNDHIGKIRPELGMNDKQVLDKHSEYMGILRDVYLFIPVDISQFNRGLADSTRKRNEDMYPRLDDFKGTGDVTENVDYALALFEPLRYNLDEFNGYDVESFVSAGGQNRFRSLSILKNSYGDNEIDFGLGFLGETGKFYELPTSKELVTHSVRSKVDKLLKIK